MSGWPAMVKVIVWLLVFMFGLVFALSPGQGEIDRSAQLTGWCMVLAGAVGFLTAGIAYLHRMKP